jgi:hypothetical protein
MGRIAHERTIFAMLMLCVVYCIPLAKFLYFASGPLLVLIGLFALKRGVRNRRMGLRKAAMAMMFFGAMKPLLFDVHQWEGDLLCGVKANVPGFPCDGHGLRMLEFACLIAFVAISIVLFQAYRVYIPDRKVKDIKPEDVNLRFWANLSLCAVLLMACWELAPWVGYLTVGSVAHVFELVTWQQLSALNVGLILWGFWKLESCSWEYKIAEKKDRRNLNTKTWTPKDTLWMTVLLFLMVLGLSYISHDILTPKDPEKQHAAPASFEQIEDMLPKTVPPAGMDDNGSGSFAH